jgi:hypothetical protein
MSQKGNKQHRKKDPKPKSPKKGGKRRRPARRSDRNKEAMEKDLGDSILEHVDVRRFQIVRR